DVDLGTWIGLGDHETELAHVGNFPAIEFRDEITFFEPGLGGGGTGFDDGYERAINVGVKLFGEVRADVRLEADAEITPGDFAFVNQTIHDIAGEVAGNGETDSGKAAAPAKDHGI